MDWQDLPGVYLDAAGDLPAPDPADYDLLLTTAPAPPAPWVAIRDPHTTLRRLSAARRQAPQAWDLLARLLRRTEGLCPEAALEMESLAFATLQSGAAFRDWLRRRPPAPRPGPAPLHEIWRESDVRLILDDPATRNALSAACRDALCSALDSCLSDPRALPVRLQGNGAMFSSGGALAEFGQAQDFAAAHLIRMERSVARRLHLLGPRAAAELQGPAIGAGIEMAAACAGLTMTRSAWVQLPELAMGLIPGAGGTVFIPRRIGRHRAFYLMTAGVRLRADEALAWGLADALAERAGDGD